MSIVQSSPAKCKSKRLGWVRHVRGCAGWLQSLRLVRDAEKRYNNSNRGSKFQSRRRHSYKTQSKSSFVEVKSVSEKSKVRPLKHFLICYVFEHKDRAEDWQKWENSISLWYFWRPIWALDVAFTKLGWVLQTLLDRQPKLAWYVITEVSSYNWAETTVRIFDSFRWDMPRHLKERKASAQDFIQEHSSSKIQPTEIRGWFSFPWMLQWSDIWSKTR